MTVDLIVKRFVALATDQDSPQQNIKFGQGHNLEIEIGFSSLESRQFKMAEKNVEQVLDLIDHKNLLLDNPARLPTQLSELVPWLARTIEDKSGLVVHDVSIKTGAGLAYHLDGQASEL